MARLNLEGLEAYIAVISQRFSEYEPYPILLSIRDGIIQRFEIAMDLSWKLMQRVLKDIYGVQVSEIRTTKDIFRKAHKSGLIHNAESWIIFYEARNQIFYIYDAQQAKEVFSVITNFFNQNTGISIEA